MSSKSNFSCDVETGICSPSKEITNEAKPKLKVIYYHDTLCGWCYGFGPNLIKLEKEFKDKIEIEVISGGLFLGNRVGRIEDVAPYIKSGAYKSVEATTGVKFGDAFLNDLFGEGKIILNSLPPSIALCIVKEKFPKKGLEFAEMLLRAVYYDGINPINTEQYKAYVTQIGLDFEEFSTNMKEDKYKKMAEEEFKIFKNSIHSGMPTLVLLKDNNQLLLSNGYLGFSELKQRLCQLIQ